MINRDNLGCGHCGRPLDMCDCGADYEISYHPMGESFGDFSDAAGAKMRRVVLVGLIISLGLVLRILF